MPKAIRIYQYGDPSVLKWEEVPIPEPGEGEVLIQQKAVGLNYIDVYHRTGLYPVPTPFTPGIEGAGVVMACGKGTQYVSVGNRVAYAKGPPGSYSEWRTIKETDLVKLPDEISFEHAAGLMTKGTTAHMLLRRSFDLRANMTALIWAAAGGVGQFLCQWANALGATVIGAVGSEEKAEFARQNGCHHVILYRREDVVKRVRDITEGRGCNVVYDSVGQATFMQSLDCLGLFGLLVSYGQSSGPVPPFDISLLREKGSLFLTRPTLGDYKKIHGEYLLGAMEMLNHVMQGKIKIHIGQSYYLADAASAHRDLESRNTIGSTILIPE